MERRLLILSSVVIIIVLILISIYILFFTSGPYGSLSVSTVDQREAAGGIIVHINDTYLKDFPTLHQLLSQDISGHMDINKDEWQICIEKFIWYGPNNEPQYYEYKNSYYLITCPKV